MMVPGASPALLTSRRGRVRPCHDVRRVRRAERAPVQGARGFEHTGLLDRPLPPLSTAKRIVAYLDRINAGTIPFHWTRRGKGPRPSPFRAATTGEHAVPLGVTDDQLGQREDDRERERHQAGNDRDRPFPLPGHRHKRDETAGKAAGQTRYGAYRAHQSPTWDKHDRRSRQAHSPPPCRRGRPEGESVCEGGARSLTMTTRGHFTPPRHHGDAGLLPHVRRLRSQTGHGEE